MKLLWSSLHESLDDLLGSVSGVNIWTYSGMSSSDVLHGGSACGVMRSGSSRIQLLILVMHIEAFVLGLILCLLLGAWGGRARVVCGVCSALCSGAMRRGMGWLLCS